MAKNTQGIQALARELEALEAKLARLEAAA